MANLQKPIDPTKSYPLMLIYEIEQALKGNDDFFSFSILCAIDKGTAPLVIINTIKDHLQDSLCICSMIDLLGVDLCDKISNF